LESGINGVWSQISVCTKFQEYYLKLMTCIRSDSLLVMGDRLYFATQKGIFFQF
jgi:hypothetical protein